MECSEEANADSKKAHQCRQDWGSVLTAVIL